MIFLLHPTHRKFIRLLRKYVQDGGLIVLTKEDQVEYETIFRISKKSLYRHQAVYKILLRAIHRPQVEITNESIIINSETVDVIEKRLRKIEQKNLYVTIKNILLMKFVRFTWNLLNLKNYKR